LESSRVAPWEGLMRRSRLAAGLLLVAALLAAWLLLPNCGRRKTAEAEPLLCYVGGTMRAAMEELARLYRHRTGREVVMDCAGSGELLIRMRATRKGDLYVCHDPFLGALRRMRLCGEAWAVASLTSVIAVAKGNPKGVRGLKDLARPDLRVGLTDAEYSTAGRIVALMLRRADLEEAVTRNVKTRTRQGGELANAIALGSLDAGIVWNAVAHLRREKLDAVPIEAEWLPRRGVDAVTSASLRSMEMDDVRVTIVTLTCSRWPAGKGREPSSPQRFDPHSLRGGNAEAHRRVGPGVRGSNRRSGEGELRRLQRPPGPNRTLQNGRRLHPRRCGLRRDGPKEGPRDLSPPPLLLRARDHGGQGQSAGHPLAGRFGPAGGAGGLGDERAAALGGLTERILRRSGIAREALTANVVLRTPTVNELGLKIKLGTVDAVIVWSSTAAHDPASSETVAIPSAANLIPTVAAATLTTARNPPAARAFVELLRSRRGGSVLARHHYVVERGQ